MKNTLIVGDLHEPFCKEGYLQFCKRIEKAFNCTRVVMIGDLVDNHAISYHEHDPDGWSPADEMVEVDKRLKKWFKAFPSTYVCRGNHDMLVDRKGKTVGLPRRCFNEFRDIWKLPDTWVDDWTFEFEGVRYQHGTGFSGRYGHVTAANANRQSTVIGHLHSTAGVQWMANEKDCIFGMSVGCGTDRHAYAFAYGKDFNKKPILGCGVVSVSKKGTNAQFVPMTLK